MAIFFIFIIFSTVVQLIEMKPVFNEERGKWEYEAGDKQNNATSLDDQTEYFQGDIVGIPKTGTSKTRNAVISPARKWPNGRIPYMFKSEYSAQQQANIMSAMSTLQSLTCLQFVQRTTETDYIYFENTNSGCNSFIGKTGGPQRVSLQRGLSNDFCLAPSSVAHELMHAAGIWHEQSRIDRDNYITINLNNVAPENRHNYDKVNAQDSSTYGTTYDYRSLMHYGKTAAAINPSINVITTKDPAFQNTIGRATGPSQTDVLKIKLLYNCPGTGTGTGTGTGGTGGTGGTNCVDGTPACSQYATMCFYQSVKMVCKSTCNNC